MQKLEPRRKHSFLLTTRPGWHQAVANEICYLCVDHVRGGKRENCFCMGFAGSIILLTMEITHRKVYARPNFLRYISVYRYILAITIQLMFCLQRQKAIEKFIFTLELFTSCGQELRFFIQHARHT